MRISLSLAAIAALALAGCDSRKEETDDGSVRVPIEDAAEAPTGESTAPAEGATPIEERVATIGLLNKRNNVSVDLEMRTGETREEGPIIITLENCERTAPHEFPQETGAFVQVDVLDRGESDHRRIFSGWLFKNNPSLNVVEHPIYDVWVKDCAMSFPGEE